MTGLLGQIRRLNGLGDRAIAEPFSGGAGASLSLLFLEETPEIFINDADIAIYNFWWAIINKPVPFSDLISTTPVSMAEWRRQRDIYRSHKNVSRLRQGFSTFYLNRCNRSGIIMNGGPIGGVKQEGKWKLDARFNKKDLSRRCERVSEYRDRIHLSNHDGIEFINAQEKETVFYFIDPPYFTKGKTLYLNALDERYHVELAERLKTMADAAWVLTYDDCPKIRQLYQGWATIRPFSLQYTASERRIGKEVVIAPKWIRLPDTQKSAAITW